MTKAGSLRWAGHVVRMEESRSAFKTYGKEIYKRPRHRWQDYDGIDCKEVRANTRFGLIRFMLENIGEPS